MISPRIATRIATHIAPREAAASAFDVPAPSARGAHLVIAIDGPSGSGKGTIARLLAGRLGWHLLDSGAIYRVLALAALQAGKHVFVEKPLALNLPDCERVLAEAEKHPDLIAMVGFVSTVAYARFVLRGNIIE